MSFDNYAITYDQDLRRGLRCSGQGPEWFAEQFEVQKPPAAALIPAISGLQTAVVTQLENDPKGEHRIMVKMPVISTSDEGIWARIATLDAGDTRGSFFLPEIGDEVVVGFLNDDICKLDFRA